MHLKPKKRLGQNFLIDRNIQGKIARSCNLGPSDTVLEIGPGRGEITSFLVEKVDKLIAIEIDKKLCGILEEKFSRYKNFNLLNQDILKVDISRFPKPLKIIANLPYYISTPVITHLLNHRKSIESIYLTLQQELGMRLAARPGSRQYGAFSCFVQFYTQPKMIFAIKSSSFWPRPKVSSCFLELKVLSQPAVKVKNEEEFFKLIRLAFGQRRKMLKNSLSARFTEAKVISGLKALKLRVNVRAEDLSLENFRDLYNLLLT